MAFMLVPGRSSRCCLIDQIEKYSIRRRRTYALFTEVVGNIVRQEELLRFKNVISIPGTINMAVSARKQRETFIISFPKREQHSVSYYRSQRCRRTLRTILGRVILMNLLGHPEYSNFTSNKRPLWMYMFHYVSKLEKQYIITKGILYFFRI